MSDPKQPVIKNVDLPLDLQTAALNLAAQALKKYNVEKDIAKYIKQEFDAKYTPTWHCVVGRSFGSFVTHESSCFIYFVVDGVSILLFKAG